VRKLAVGLAGVGLVLAGGAGIYTLSASGSTPGCPRVEKLRDPIIDFTQDPGPDYIDVTLTNPNACYGFRDEPVEITLYGAQGRRFISYFGDGPPHGDVGVCCTVTLPPHGTWTVRLGAKGQNPSGRGRRTVCNIHVEAIKSKGYSVWKRMPDGGTITGHGSFPPKSVFDPDKYPPLPDDPTLRTPCESPTPS
jgi:hypothetical protein